MAALAYTVLTESPVKNDIQFWDIVGHEALSRPSFYELTVLSEKSSLNPKDVLGQVFKVVVDFADNENKPHGRRCEGVAVKLVKDAVTSRVVCFNRIVIGKLEKFCNRAVFYYGLKNFKNIFVLKNAGVSSTC